MNKLDKEVMELLWTDDTASYTIHQIFESINTGRMKANSEAVKFPTIESSIRRLTQRGDVKSQKTGRNVTYMVGRKKAEVGIEALRKISSEFFGGNLVKLIPHLSANVDHIDPEIQALLDKIQELDKPL